MNKKNFLAQIFLLTLLFFVLFATSVSAVVTPPNFPSCVNPQGSIKTSYNSGTHALPGDTNSYQGSDTVYSVSDTTLTQCLCTEDGDGKQTNWWKVSSLTSSEIETLKTQGWVYIPDGAVWGLEATAYFAKNTEYACRGGGIGGGEVLGLATTGNIKTIYLLFTLGFLSLTAGYLLNRKGV